MQELLRLLKAGQSTLAEATIEHLLILAMVFVCMQISHYASLI